MNHMHVLRTVGAENRGTNERTTRDGKVWSSSSFRISCLLQPVPRKNWDSKMVGNTWKKGVSLGDGGLGLKKLKISGKSSPNTCS